MSPKIMQVNAKLVVTPQEFDQICNAEAAQPFAGLPGMEWKVWILSRDTAEAGGIYLFEDEDCLRDYLNSTFWTGVKNLPVWKDCQVKVFDVLTAPSSVTHAPLGRKAPGTFNQMVQEALTAVPTIKPADAYRRLQKEPDLLVIDVRDLADIEQTGTVPGASRISLGSLTYKADTSLPEGWWDVRLSDHTRPIITTCILGPLGALAGRLLQDLGFTNVQILEGGVQAWMEAGLPVEK